MEQTFGQELTDAVTSDSRLIGSSSTSRGRPQTFRIKTWIYLLAHWRAILRCVRLTEGTGLVTGGVCWKRGGGLKNEEMKSFPSAIPC